MGSREAKKTEEWTEGRRTGEGTDEKRDKREDGRVDGRTEGRIRRSDGRTRPLKDVRISRLPKQNSVKRNE